MDRTPVSLWLIVGLGPGGLGFESGTPKVANPFHFRGFQESKPPGPKPTITPLKFNIAPEKLPSQ